MKKVIYIVSGICLLLLLCGSVQASDPVSITIKNVFTQKEQVSFDYVIHAPPSLAVSYERGVNCDNLPLPFLNTIKATSSAEGLITGSYTGFTVDSMYYNCYAYVSISSPYRATYKKTFVISAPEAASLTALVCGDKNCTNQQKVFTAGQKIYLDYSGSFTNAKVTATLVGPGKSSAKINLPYSFTAATAGSYQLKAAASNGTTTLNDIKDFAVIGQNAQFAVVKTKPLSSLNNMYLIITLIGAIVVLALLAGVIFVFLRRKK